MSKNVSLGEISQQLANVFADTEQMEQYNSANEMYDGVCGWCGVMAPLSRPAYVKTFGESVTAAAEMQAREILVAKDARRKATKYYEHAQEANRQSGIPALGGYFWAEGSGLKCDGGKGLFKELHNRTCYESTKDCPPRLCYVGQVIEVSEEEFNRPELADELVASRELCCGCRSDDVSEDEDYMAVISDREKVETFYTVGALVVAPSGKYFLLDSEGYSYARYIYLPTCWKQLFAEEVEAIQAEEDARVAEAEREAAEAKAKRLEDYNTRSAKWLPLMKDVRSMVEEKSATKTQILAARKANILAMCRATFPGVKFTVHVEHGWGADFLLRWEDGPTEEEFKEKADIDLFCRCRDTFDGWDDSTDTWYAEFTEFAAYTMCGCKGDIQIERVMSGDTLHGILEEIAAVAPAVAEDRVGHQYTEEEMQAVADLVGVSRGYLFRYGNRGDAVTFAYMLFDQRSYTPAAQPKADKPKPQTTDEDPADGLQLVAIEGGVAVVGDSRTTYKNRKEIKAHGGTWNKEEKRWQATTADGVKSLKKWFGVNQ